MTDEESDRIIELLLTDPSAGLKTYAALTREQRKQVLGVDPENETTS
jgi:hypothetical protein